jgi:S-(hydroxymethyl)glutathione dehydrogenase/alcohol dehydrogenase
VDPVRRAVFDLYLQRRLFVDELVTRTYPLAQAKDAFADLAAGRNARGVLLFDEP